MTQLAIWFTLLLFIVLAIIAIPIFKKQHKEMTTPKPLIAAMVLTPIISLSAYFYLGTPQFADIDTNAKPIQIVSLADELHNKLNQKPDDLNGWLLLGRSYMIEQRTDEAIMAFERALSIKPNLFQAMLPLADALALKANGQFGGRAHELLLKSYEINPNNKMVLWLLGMAEKQANQYDRAKQHWLHLYNNMNHDDSDRPIIAKLLKSVGYGGVADAPKTQDAVVNIQNHNQKNTKEIQGLNALSIELKELSTIQEKFPNSTAFIYAKAIEGMPMPIMARKIRLEDLTNIIRLSPKDLIMPARQLKDEPSFVVGIRISQTASVNSQDIKQEQVVEHGEVVIFDLQQSY
jgi:cytochrome c-type biogenesis protein CcmH